MKVLLPTPLAGYTANRREVEAGGATLADLFDDLDRRYPGIRFRMIDEHDRIRPHMRLFVNSSEARELSAAVHAGDTVHVICALSGG